VTAPALPPEALQILDELDPDERRLVLQIVAELTPPTPHVEA